MNVPCLRFEEFNEDWNLKQIDDIATVSSGGTPSRTNKDFWDGDIPWVTTSEVKFNIIRDTEQKITEQGLQSSSAKIFPKDTLLIAMYGQGKTRGQIAKLEIAASTNQACAALILKDSNSPDFFFQYLQNQYENLRSLSNDGGQKNLSASLIKSVSVAFPGLPEQTKIANFLTAVDEKITQLTQKCDLLAQYKKGVMQQIFSQELRFKDDDGRDFPEWEEKKITNLIKNKKGALKIGPFGSELKRSTFVKNGFKVYGQENIFVNDFNFGDRYITEDHFNKLKANVLHHNDFVISTMGTIGKCAIVPNNIEKGIMDSHMIRLQLNEHIISSDFLSQIFGSFLVLKQVKRLSVGGIMDGLSIGIINELKFFIPSSLKEQTKIAKLLTAIDDKITNTQAQLVAVKQYKQGLLQQMFV
jgi:type I restriction enzyme S subunit